MAGKRSDLSRDYFVALKRHPRLPLWSWEIHRRSKPLGVKLFGDDFQSAAAAKVAGNKALEQLLERIIQEKDETAN
jgi:hypothetical protein